MDQGDLRFEPINDSFSPVSFELINKVKNRVGSLPDDYVDFITTFGGCGFSGDAMVSRSDGKRFPIFTFFGNEGSQNLYEVLDCYPDLESDNKLPIADDMMGNIFVLDPHNGHIFFIDFTQRVATAYQLASSFREFLEAIQVTPFEDDE